MLSVASITGSADVPCRKGHADIAQGAMRRIRGRTIGFHDERLATHAATAELLDDAVVRDGLADHWRESYVGEAGKSSKRWVVGGSTGQLRSVVEKS